MSSNYGEISKKPIEASAKIDYLNRASQSFAKLSKITPMNKRSYERQSTANKWLSFIDDERKHLIDSCSAWRHNRSGMKELCFIKIKQAYNRGMLAGTFELEDKKCEIYLAEYDSIFRKYDSIFRVKVSQP